MKVCVLDRIEYAI